VHERIFLIDCGEGTQMRMRQERIKMSRLDNIFISHTHGDHIFGLYGLLSTLNLLGRVKPINLCAPENFGPLLISHLADFDIHLNYEVNFIPLKGKDPVKVYEDKTVSVVAFPLKHRVPTFGFLFREKERPRTIKKEAIEEYNIPISAISSIKGGNDFITTSGEVVENKKIAIDPRVARSFAYCSDTLYFTRLSSFVKGVDLLYHEATFASDMTQLAHETGHSTSCEAATVAKEAGVGKLILGHFSARYREVDQLVSEAREIFPETAAGEEGVTYRL
jgi:ribonuclease Z